LKKKKSITHTCSFFASFCKDKQFKRNSGDCFGQKKRTAIIIIKLIYLRFNGIAYGSTSSSAFHWRGWS